MASTVSPPHPASVEIWVSSEGDDGAAGGMAAPFRTLRRAHEELCAVAERMQRGEVTVVIGDGTYRLDAPLVFDPARFGPDGPAVRFRAAPGASPTISGAVRVEGWTCHDPVLNIHKARVGAVRSRQLYVDGRRAVRARTTMPDGGIPAGFRPKPVLPPDAKVGDACTIGGGIAFEVSDLNPPAWRDPTKWSRKHRIEAIADVQWRTLRVPIDDVTADGVIHLRQPAWTNANVYVELASSPSSPLLPAIWGFWQVTRFENAYEFLDEPGEFYLDEDAGELYYIPRPGEDLATADVELPVLERLIVAHGEAEHPVAGLAFEGITFAYATWWGPDDEDGYVADQSGWRVVGRGHRLNVTGHVERVERSPGNLSFAYARDVRFEGCGFEHLGAVALDLGTGSQRVSVVDSRFEDVSSAAIQLGGVGPEDYHPTPAGLTCDATISNNLIQRTGRDYVDSAAIFVGFSRNTEISHNTIREVPWSGISIGWGWGLLDPGGYPGVSGATRGMWGEHPEPTPNSHNRILRNHISRFIEDRWDGGAIYTTGQQGQGPGDPLIIEGNVACNKRPQGGGNTFYTDGGSRYVVLRRNASFDNPIGVVDFGPPPRAGDLPRRDDRDPSKLNGIPYGGDIGGCLAYGDIRFEDNHWRAGLIPLEEGAMDVASEIAGCLFGQCMKFHVYLEGGFFSPCVYGPEQGISGPRLELVGNHDMPLGKIEVPEDILRDAGVRPGRAKVAPAGSAPSWGGASFPPRSPGPSWNVPRVSLPGLFGVQPEYATEWWYYVGLAYDAAGRPFSLQIEIGRSGAGGLQVPWGIVGVGWRDAQQRSLYLSGVCAGLGVSSCALSPASMHAAPVSDRAYDLRFVPLVQIVGRSADLIRDLSPNLAGSSSYRFEYLAGQSAGAPVGAAGSCYALSVRGKGLVTHADDRSAERADYGVSLTVTDRRGTVMEGVSGYVGPGMFPGDDGTGLASYECAEPRLDIRRGGTLVLGGTTHSIEGGRLWLDRQMITSPTTTGEDGSAAGAPRARGALQRLLASKIRPSRQLYLGDWIGVVLADGTALVLAEFWRKSTPQWITGTLVGRPPKEGFGNLYFDDARPPVANGGLALRARTSIGDEDWDFDVNILDPGDPARSPHWRSPWSGKTYATALQVSFSRRMVARGLPPALHAFVVSDNCEIMAGAAEGAFFEGAALVYADRERRHPLGQAFVEQMGFD